jgi:serine/threonine-protein kinase
MLVGKTLGPYTVDKEIGSGAMGTVYRAKHKETGERVAVKLMSPALGTGDQARARFLRELEILKQLNHPNIVRYKGSGRYHGAPFFIMEFVEGDSLDRVMARRDRLSWEEIIELGRQLCAALQHAHDKGIIHRDLKPSNVMMLRDGTFKLTDFGIAKDTDVTALTAANSTVGTAAYMSPEQCRGARDITYKSDLYSLGVMLYELMTGRKPFTADTAMEMFMKHANAPFAPPSQWVPDCPPWLNTIIVQLMEKKPEQRPLNASTVSESLEMVRDKVQNLTSAGLDTAKKRRMDRLATDLPLDEADKEAARAMLGKKKKKKKKPFYTKGWFTLTAVACLLIVFATFVYFVFIRAPSADSLYAQAKALTDGGTTDDDHKRARREPITDFLAYYPNDPRAPEVQALADKVDLELAEKQMLTRRERGIGVYLNLEERKAEDKARLALDNEDIGALDKAAQYWTELLPYKNDKAHPEQRPWGLIAEKYLRDLQFAESTPQRLHTLLQSEKIMKTKEGNGDDEKLALQAMREENAENWKDALDTWTMLKNKTTADAKTRQWHLLAAKKVRELKSRNDAPDSEKSP